MTTYCIKAGNSYFIKHRKHDSVYGFTKTTIFNSSDWTTNPNSSIDPITLFRTAKSARQHIVRLRKLGVPMRGARVVTWRAS